VASLELAAGFLRAGTIIVHARAPAILADQLHDEVDVIASVLRQPVADRHPPLPAEPHLLDELTRDRQPLLVCEHLLVRVQRQRAAPHVRGWNRHTTPAWATFRRLERRADKRMNELERANRCEDLRRREPIGSQLAGNGVELGEPRGEAHLRARAKDRDRARKRDCLLAQTPQPRENRGPHSSRRDAPQRPNALTAGRQRLLTRGEQELAQEQGIAAGQLGARRAGRLFGIHVQLGAHDSFNGRCTQRPERDALDIPVGRQSGELRALSIRIPSPHRHHHQQREIGRPSREVTEPCQRRVIGPLCIVDRHHERATLSAVRAQPVEPVKRREPISGRFAGLHAERMDAHVGNTGNEAAPLRRRGRAEHRLKQLTRDPERDLLLEL